MSENAVWAPGTEVVGKYNYSGPTAHVSIFDVITVIY